MRGYEPVLRRRSDGRWTALPSSEEEASAAGADNAMANPSSEDQQVPSPAGAEAIRDLARRQFGAAAAEYVSSRSHAHGTSLARMLELAPPAPRDRVLDVATGAGHAALTYAPHVAEV